MAPGSRCVPAALLSLASSWSKFVACGPTWHTTLPDARAAPSLATAQAGRAFSKTCQAGYAIIISSMQVEEN